MPGTFKVGRVFGIEVSLHWSWALIFVLVTFSFAEGVLRDAFPDWEAPERWGAGVMVALVFFLSLLAHELSHSVVARRLGIPVSGITLFIFGGSSNLERDPDTAQHEAVMAAVGPLTSFLIGVAFAIGYVALDSLDSPVADVFADLSFINIAIACFNLIPGFPTDGGRLLRSWFWSRGRDVTEATRLAATVGEAFATLFMGFGVLLLLFVDIFSGLWLLLIGNFLRSSSIGSYEQVLMDRVIGGVPATAVVRRHFLTVGPEETVADIIDQHFLAGHGRCIPVVAGTELLGLVTLTDVSRLPREQWPVTTAYRAMTPASELKTVSPSDTLARVVEIIAREQVNQVPMVQGKEIVGMIERSDVVDYIEARQTLTSGRHPHTQAPAVGH